MMFNEATNSWEKLALVRPGPQLSLVFHGDGGKAMEGQVLHLPLQETKT